MNILRLTIILRYPHKNECAKGVKNSCNRKAIHVGNYFNKPSVVNPLEVKNALESCCIELPIVNGNAAASEAMSIASGTVAEAQAMSGDGSYVQKVPRQTFTEKSLTRSKNNDKGYSKCRHTYCKKDLHRVRGGA